MTLVRALVPEGLGEASDGLAAVAAAAGLARRLQGRVHVLIAGAKAESDLDDAAFALGAGSVDRLVHPGLAPSADVEAFTATFAAALGNARICGDEAPAVTLLPPAGIGEEIAARLASRTGAVALGRCTQIALEGDGLAVRRAAFGGRAVAQLRCPPNAFAVMRAAVAKSGGISAPAASKSVRRWPVESPLPPGPRVSLREIAEKKRPLEGARVVVCGGRGMGGPEGFAMLEELAATLGGAVGGSLPTVDAGWMPVARQVGQSGKFVAPEIYVAVGISGTPQHLAGVAPETRVIAINKDAEAEIFRVAEIGLVGDWKEVLPRLVDHLRNAVP